MAVARQMVVFGQGLRDPGAVGDFEHRREPVGCGLVRSEQAKVMILFDHVAQEDAHDPRRLAVGLPWLGNRDRVIGEVPTSRGKRRAFPPPCPQFGGCPQASQRYSNNNV